MNALGTVPNGLADRYVALVTGEVDYDKLVERFGTQRIDDALRERIRNHTVDLHPLLKRGLFFSHRDVVGAFLKGHQQRREKARERLDDFMLRD